MQSETRLENHMLLNTEQESGHPCGAMFIHIFRDDFKDLGNQNRC